MPSKDAHLTLAQHNQDLIDHLLPDIDRFSDWITTVAFYRALHLVEALFATDPTIRHGGDHVRRMDHLKRNKKYSNIYKVYRPLFAASTVARYLEDKVEDKEYTSFSKYLSVEGVKTTILNHYLRRIESGVEQLLGVSLKKPDAGPPSP